MAIINNQRLEEVRKTFDTIGVLSLPHDTVGELLSSLEYYVNEGSAHDRVAPILAKVFDDEDEYSTSIDFVIDYTERILLRDDLEGSDYHEIVSEILGRLQTYKELFEVVK